MRFGADRSCLAGIDTVIPICARILGTGDVDDSHDDERPIPSNEKSLPDHLSRLCTSSRQQDDFVHVLRAPAVEVFPEDGEEPKPIGSNTPKRQGSADPHSRTLKSSLKPSSKFTSISYIRRTEDISGYILLYLSIHSQPLSHHAHASTPAGVVDVLAELPL